MDALIGDAYLRSRASIVPVHFLDLSSAVEKLRWAEKEWRELEQQRQAEATAKLESEKSEPTREAEAVRSEPLVAQAERATQP